MTIFTQAMEILTKIVSAWGMIWIVWGVITLAEGWNESNTPLYQGGLEGLDHTISTMIEWLEYGDLKYDFKILGTMVNRNKVDYSVIKFLRLLFKERVFTTTIRYQSKPVVSSSLSKEILIKDSKSNVANDYRAFVDELLATNS